MSILKWLKENVFDWSSEMPVYRGHRPPEHDPGWSNRQRVAKRANKRLHSDRSRRSAKSKKSSGG